MLDGVYEAHASDPLTGRREEKPAVWSDYMRFVHSSAEVQGVVYGVFGLIVSVPAALLGQLFRVAPFVPNAAIPSVMSAVMLSVAWLVSYHLPEIDRANLITAAGLGGLLSGAAHDAHATLAKGSNG